MSIPHQGIKVNLSAQQRDFRLPRTFYARDTRLVARELLGKRVVRFLGRQRLAGIIVEAEAYAGTDDAASHAYRGRTSRNWPMFGSPGHAYVYFVYGMHWMFNIVAHEEDWPGAILIRALEPEAGLSVMCQHRGGKPTRVLTNGPAKLAQALAIDDALNGADLCTHGAITIESGLVIPDASIVCGPRLRVPGDEQAKTRLWRFWVRDNVYVSS